MRFCWPIMASAWLQLINLMETNQTPMRWTPVFGLPDYEVSQDGCIRPINPRYKKNAFGIKQFMRKLYLFVRIKRPNGGKFKNVHVHRAVAESFIDNPLGLPCVNHKDGCKLNNRVDNLEWVSYKQNTAHAMKLGLFKIKGEYSPFHKLKAHQVIEIVKRKKAGERHQDICHEYGVVNRAIRDIMRGETWSSVTGIQKTL